MRKWLPAFLIAVGFSLGLWAYPRLPELVVPRWNLWVPWPLPNNSEALPRALAAFGLPIGALGTWALLSAVMSGAGERFGRRVVPTWLLSDRTGAAAIERFAPTLTTIITVVIAFLLLIHVAAVATMLEWPSWTVRASFAAIGLGIGIIGNVMPRTRPNWIAGLRTKHAMRDPDLWRTIHRRFGMGLMLTGIVVVAAAVFVTPYALPIALAGGLASAIAAHASAKNDGAGEHGGRSSMPTVLLLMVLVLRFP